MFNFLTPQSYFYNQIAVHSITCLIHYFHPWHMFQLLAPPAHPAHYHDDQPFHGQESEGWKSWHFPVNLGSHPLLQHVKFWKEKLNWRKSPTKNRLYSLKTLLWNMKNEEWCSLNRTGSFETSCYFIIKRNFTSLASILKWPGIILNFIQLYLISKLFRSELGLVFWEP